MHGLANNRTIQTQQNTAEHIPVVRQSSGERRAIVKSVLGLSFGELDRSLESVDLLPVLQDRLLLLREHDLVFHVCKPAHRT